MFYASLPPRQIRTSLLGKPLIYQRFLFKVGGIQP